MNGRPTPMSIPDLPPEVAERAFRTADGACAWPREHVFEAIKAAANQGLAIVFGEVWLVKDGRVKPRALLQNGQITAISWDSNPRDLHEEWPHYVFRSARENWNLIVQLDMENEVAPPVRHLIHYHFSFADEPEYETIWTEPEAAAEAG